jgi:hypothetical protein
MSNDSITAAIEALDQCDRVVDRLHKMCCEPDRSPRMLTIKESISSARADIENATADSDAVGRSLATLEMVGGQLGSLQVGCCAPARMPLYADALRQLTEVQLNVSKSVGQGH